jgi:hypothetical protein
MAFNITNNEFNVKIPCVNDSKLFFAYTEKQFDKAFIALKRIVIKYAKEDKKKIPRFKLVN